MRLTSHIKRWKENLTRLQRIKMHVTLNCLINKHKYFSFGKIYRWILKYLLWTSLALLLYILDTKKIIKKTKANPFAFTILGKIQIPTIKTRMVSISTLKKYDFKTKILIQVHNYLISHLYISQFILFSNAKSKLQRGLKDSNKRKTSQYFQIKIKILKKITNIQLILMKF